MLDRLMSLNPISLVLLLGGLVLLFVGRWVPAKHKATVKIFAWAFVMVGALMLFLTF